MPIPTKAAAFTMITVSDHDEVRRSLLPRLANHAVSRDPDLLTALNERINIGNLFRKRNIVLPVDMVATRLERHRAVLAAHGIADIGTLGRLDINGIVTPQIGVTIPTPGLYRQRVAFAHAQLPGDDGLVPTSGNAQALAALPPPINAAGVVPLGTAYWAAEEIVLAPDTKVVIRQPQMYLTIICERITFGEGACISWEEPTGEVLKYTGSGPQDPPPRPDADSLAGTPGRDGRSGGTGMARLPSANAPELELWTLNLKGGLVVALRGQDGLPGGDGQAAQPGGDGADGLPEEPVWGPFGILVDCRRGHGAGGRGGAPGRSGDGGPGGNGGHGGRITLYAPADEIQAVGKGFKLNCDGGDAGPGGQPGQPAPGGAGGARGAGERCRTSEPREAGAVWENPDGGRMGLIGNPGPPGTPGGDYGDQAQMFIPISATAFRAKLHDPVLATVEPTRARAGDVVTVYGLRLPADGQIWIGGPEDPQPTKTTVDEPSRLHFTVPGGIAGGQQMLELRRPHGTSSNKATVVILPSIAKVTGDGDKPDRLTPGDDAIIEGTGFTTDAAVRIAGIDQPNVRYQGPGLLRFSVLRPDEETLPPVQRTGEATELTVVIPTEGGISTPPFAVTIATYRILVIGDSVAWGQGLKTSDKYYTKVEAQVLTPAARDARQRVYTDVLAHSGATIGIGDTSFGPFGGAIENEVPVSYPTVLQQASTYASDPANMPGHVDLILLTAGVNDVDVRRILNPFTAFTTISDLVDKHCYGGVRAIISQVATQFPNAKIVACGYYPFISPSSNTNMIQTLLTEVGVSVEVPDPLKSTVIAQSRLFHTRSTTAIRAAVHAANEDLDPPRVMFADPAFGEENAALTDDPWLHGLTDAGRPEGNRVVNDERARACAVRYSGNLFDRSTCESASIGHPNATGASHYADAILATLKAEPLVDELKTLPAFPNGFQFGVGTAGHQVEGNPPANDWTFALGSPNFVDRARKALSIANADPHATFEPVGDGVAHRDLGILRDDLKLGTALGLRYYRMSVEWSRLQPDKGASDGLNPGALEYYRNAVLSVRDAGMTPIVTLNHLTLPLWVLTPPAANKQIAIPEILAGVPVARPTTGFKRSLRGWESRETVDAYVKFVGLVVDSLGDLVNMWITVNEPVGSTVGAGYFAGVWPPGFLLDEHRGLKAYQNLIRAHVLAYDAIKARQPATSQVGFAHNIMKIKRTIFPGALDNDSARDQMEYFYNDHWLEATLRGSVDEAFECRGQDRLIADPVKFFGNGFDRERAWPRADFIGLNYYRSIYGYADEIVNLTIPHSGGAFHNYLPGKDEPHNQLNDMGWEIYPVGLEEIADRIAVYDLPLVITENGIPEPSNANRAPFIVAHLVGLASALQQGRKIQGYLHWTLVDNFEWLDGYWARFGLYSVDRGQTGLNGSGARTVTEGGLAFAHVATTGDVASAAEIFGRYDPEGYVVHAPRLSMSHLHARLSGGPDFELILGSEPGFVRTGADGAWCRLARVTFDENASWLTIEGSINGRMRTLTATRMGPDFVGTAEDGTPWQASADPLVGTWNSLDLAISEVSFLRLGTSLTAKVLPGFTPPVWLPAREVTFDGTTVTWTVPYGSMTLHFIGKVEGPTISGTVDTAGLGLLRIPWSATRRAAALV